MTASSKRATQAVMRDKACPIIYPHTHDKVINR